MAYPFRIMLVAILVAAIAYLVLGRGTKPVPGSDSSPDRLSTDGSDRKAGAGDAVHLEPIRRNLRDVTPPSVHRPPSPDTAMVERLPPVARPQPPRRRKQRRWQRPVVLSAGLLESAGTRIIIEGIEAVGLDAVCGNEELGTWPCGKFARTALQRLIRSRTISCDLTGGQDHPAEITTSCSISGHDIGAWLVGAGWAAVNADSAYAPLESEARGAGRGQWSRTSPP